MMSTAPALSDSVIASYRELQKNATALSDIAAWYKKHPEVLGKLPTHTPEQLSIKVDFSTAAIVAVLLGKYQETGLRVRVEIMISQEQVEVSPYGSITGIEALQFERGMSYTTKFEMAFADWPLAIAAVAYDYVANDCYSGNYKPVIVAKALALMNEYLPKHFPGVTVDWLKTMHSLDYLVREEEEITKNNLNGYNQDAFMRILFATRSTEVTNDIPQDLSL